MFFVHQHQLRSCTKYIHIPTTFKLQYNYAKNTRDHWPVNCTSVVTKS